MILEAKRKQISPLLFGLLLLIMGILIGTLADPAAWFRGAGPAGPGKEPSRLPSREGMPENGLETIRLTLSEDAERTIRTVRDRAVEKSQIVQEDGDTVEASLTHSSRKYPVEIRIKGDLTDHVKTDKWSFRITLLEGKLFGMREFSVQNPATRGYMWEWLVHEAAHGEDLIAPRSCFVNLEINGRPSGIYFLEEHLGKEMLEAQGRREGPIVLFDESTYWAVSLSTHTSALNVQRPQIRPLRQNSGQAGIRVFGEKRLRSVEALNRALMNAIEKMRELKYSLAQSGEYDRLFKLQALNRCRAETLDELLDTRQWAKAHALQCLFQISHGLVWINLRMYLNPLTDRLEPILFDSMAHQVKAKGLELFNSDPLIQRLKESGSYETAFFQHLGYYCEGTFLDSLFEALEPEMRVVEASLVEEIKLLPSFTLDGMKQRLRSQQICLKDIIHVTDPVNFTCTFEKAPGGGTTIDGVLEVEAWATTQIPVMLGGFRFSNGGFLKARSCMEDSDEEVHTTDEGGVLLRGTGRLVRFRFRPDARLANLSNIQEIKRAIRSGAKERSALKLDDVFAVYTPVASGAKREELLRFHPYESAWKAEKGRPPSVSLGEALKRHACLDYDIEMDRLELRCGTWDVEGDLLVPRGHTLHAYSGTQLRFDEGAALISESSLSFEGTAEKPVVLAPREGRWSGVVVLNAVQRSTWKHVIVKDTEAIARAGWIFTGGVTFYHAPVRFLDTLFDGTAAEDGLNVFGTNLHMERTTFARCASDSFDGDFVTGEIVDCVFRDGLADGLDLSGSDVTVKDCRFFALGDKAVSAGEETVCRILGGVMEGVSIGLAAKDLAQVEMEGVEINNVEHFVVAVYVKKPEYGPARVAARGLRISEKMKTPFLVQTGNTLIVDGEAVPTREVDVERLYDAKILGN